MCVCVCVYIHIYIYIARALLVFPPSRQEGVCSRERLQTGRMFPVSPIPTGPFMNTTQDQNLSCRQCVIAESTRLSTSLTGQRSDFLDLAGQKPHPTRAAPLPKLNNYRGNSDVTGGRAITNVGRERSARTNPGNSAPPSSHGPPRPPSGRDWYKLPDVTGTNADVTSTNFCTNVGRDRSARTNPENSAPPSSHGGSANAMLRGRDWYKLSDAPVLQ